MSYVDQKGDPALVPLAGAAATDVDLALGTAAVVAVAYPGLQPFEVVGLSALVTTQFDTADTVLTVRKRITLGSDTGSTIIGTMTIPNGALVGKVYYKKFAAVKVSPGDELVISTDGGTTAGTAIVRLEVQPSWDAPGNNADMIAAA